MSRGADWYEAARLHFDVESLERWPLLTELDTNLFGLARGSDDVAAEAAAAAAAAAAAGTAAATTTTTTTALPLTLLACPVDSLVGLDRVLARYVANLADELGRPGHRTTVYPGVRELLGAVEAHGDCTLGLLTGNVAAGARLKLGSAGLDFARFRVGAFGSDHVERGELPAVALRRAREVLGVAPVGHDLVIIGDTPADVGCGRAVGARAIGVGTAAYTAAELIAAGADAVFADFTDTARVVEAILG
jgi:phosphoglycolate phosphatase-like HAD superfamily hydrolase